MTKYSDVHKIGELRIRPDVPPNTNVVRLLVPPRVWSHMEGSQVYATLRAIGAGSMDPADSRVIEYHSAADLSLMKQLVDAPVTRKDRRFYVWLTEDEARCLRGYVEAMQAGASDNTWDEDGRADLFSATKFLEQMAKAGV